MFNSFAYFRNTRYLVTTAVILAVLVVLGIPTIFVKIGGSSFQIVDGFYMALVCIIPGPMMFVVGLLWPVFFDLAAGAFAYIPMSILIRFLIFVSLKLLKKPLSNYGAMLLAGLWIFLYLPYNYGLYLSLGKESAQAMMVKELITDAIQYGLSVLIGSLLVAILVKPRIAPIFTFTNLQLPTKKQPTNH